MSGDSLFRCASFCLVVALALGLPAAPLRAVVVTFGAPSSEVAAGGSVHIELFILNPSGESVSYPTEFLTGNFALYLLAQYWTGYGGSLLHYDQRSSTARIGFSLAR